MFTKFTQGPLPGLFLILVLFFVYPAKAQVADLIIQKTGPTNVEEGMAMQYTITISNNGPTAVSNASFNDTFPTGVSNVTLGSCTASGGAICPDASNYTISTILVPPNTRYNFKGTIPSLPVDGSVTFIINLKAPTFSNFSSFSNTATVTVPNGITDPDLSTNTSTWNTVLIETNPDTINVDIAVSKTLDDPNGYDCSRLPKTYRYTVKWINKGPVDARNVQLVDDLYSIRSTNSDYEYSWKIKDTTWRTALGSVIQPSSFQDTGQFSPPTSPGRVIFKRLYMYVPLFKKGDTITFSFSFTLYPPAYSGCGGQISWVLGNRGSFQFSDYRYRDTFPANDDKSVESGLMTCSKPTSIKNVDIKVLKTVDDTRGYSAEELPQSYNYTVKWINLGPIDVPNVYLRDVFYAYDVMVMNSGTTEYIYKWAISNVVWKTSPGTQVTNPYGFTSGTSYIIPTQVAPATSSEEIKAMGASVPLFERGDTITLTFTFTLDKPTMTGCGRSDLTWDLYNSATFILPDCYKDTVPGNDRAIVTSGKMRATRELCIKTDLKVFKSVDDKSGYPCEQLPKKYKFVVKWVNGGTESIDSVSLFDNVYFDAIFTGTGAATYRYPISISDVQWSASTGLTAPTDTFNFRSGIIPMPYCSFISCNNKHTFAQIISRVPKMNPGDTVTLTYTVHVARPSVTGCGKNISWNLGGPASILSATRYNLFDTVPANNDTIVVSGKFTATATDLVVSKSVNPAIVNTGDPMSVSVEFYNASGSPAIPATWTDTLPATFQIDAGSIQCTPITGSPPCGNITYDPATRVLQQTIANMPANSGVKITFNGMVNSLYTVTEFNKAYAFYSCLDCVPSTNFTQTNYQINGNCDSVFAGIDGDTSISVNSRDTIYLSSVLNSRSQPGGTWIRLSGNGGTLDAAAGIFIVNSAITTSVFRYTLPGKAPCPADTSYVTIRLLSPPAPDTISGSIPTNSADTLCGFLPPVTGNITVTACDQSTSGTGLHGNWSIDPITQCLQFVAASLQGSDTLCLTICDTSTGLCTNTVVVIIVTGVPPVAVNDEQIFTPGNTPVIIPVLNNDLSPDQDPLELCTPPISSQPGHGTITVNQDGSITYIPASGYIGVDSFQYVICDKDGSDTAWVTLYVGCEPESGCCAIPNAFTPNRDGVNDLYRARCTCVLLQFYLVVYDRWGEKLYESTDAAAGWDGYYQGERIQADAYAYYLEYTPLCTQKKVIRKGNVTVLK